jgi:hypothetical protein
MLLPLEQAEQTQAQLTIDTTVSNTSIAKLAFSDSKMVLQTGRCLMRYCWSPDLFEGSQIVEKVQHLGSHRGISDRFLCSL